MVVQINPTKIIVWGPTNQIEYVNERAQLIPQFSLYSSNVVMGKQKKREKMMD